MIYISYQMKEFIKCERGERVDLYHCFIMHCATTIKLKLFCIRLAH